jgi:hypothetical protein
LRSANFSNAPNDSPVAFNEGKFVGKATFGQDAYTMVAGYIRSSSEGHILADAKIGVVDEFCQDVQTSGNGRLNLV